MDVGGSDWDAGQTWEKRVSAAWREAREKPVNLALLAFKFAISTKKNFNIVSRLILHAESIPETPKALNIR